jgi:hypothetical protein
MPDPQPFLTIPSPFACEMDAGDHQSVDHIPIACKDAVAILYMFDLTSRCTLNKLVFRSVPNNSNPESHNKFLFRSHYWFSFG